MADQDQFKTYGRDPRITQPGVQPMATSTSGNGTGMALIIGGLVVAVGFILWLVFGEPGLFATSPAGQSTGDTTNVTIETPAAPAVAAPDATVAPAVEADEPPAPVPAPVDE